MGRLRRSDLSTAGITRRRRGRGWSYRGPDGRPLGDPVVLERINGLVIPPAWSDVWICPYPNGHIQAVGTDAAGRRQYRYHDDWQTRRSAAKFGHIVEVARSLPRVRECAARDLARPGLGRRRVLGCAVRLLDIGFFRVGGEEYAERNDSFGLATIRRDHVSIEDDTIIFDYPAKSGKRRVQAVADAGVVQVVRELLDRPEDGPADLLVYVDEDDPTTIVDVHSRDINDYLGEAAGGLAITAKDFRTWSATVLAAVALAVSAPTISSPTARKRAISRMYAEVASYLGNTPAVCRASYVHPRVVDLFRDGYTITLDLAELGVTQSQGPLSIHGPIEEAVLALLAQDPRARVHGSATRRGRQARPRPARARGSDDRRAA
jgi:DNA topoisomerase-1